MSSFSKKTSCVLMVLVVVLSLGLGGVAGGLASWWIVVSSDQPSGSFDMPFAGTEIYKVEESSAVIAAVEKVSPSVVSVILTKNVRSYYGDVYQENGGGTGFIISSDGLIITNRHVVNDEMAEYSVITSDGISYQASVKSIDPLNDLAIVEIDAEGLPVVELGDSSSLKIGQKVIAIGNALNEYQNTVTTGVVSAVDRNIMAGDGFGVSEQYENMIQTDAAINPGNSGGPLVDLSGRVVGINTAVDVVASNIGFAIPINQAQSAIESVLEFGRIIRPRLGIRYIPITPEFAALNQIDLKQGALIYSGNNLGELAVIPGGPADVAGLQENDIVVSVNGKKIDENYSLSGLLQQYKPGDTVEIEYVRDGDVNKTDVTLDEMK
ncbi:trypsin-like peptidase domain-containing protein [Patescibacteria group bacterium]|nr:trypsin-like peptidase domain-containing protein [Patescibacteria group bacterium]